MKHIFAILFIGLLIQTNIYSQELLTGLKSVNISWTGGTYLDATNPNNNAKLNIYKDVQEDLVYKLRMAGLKVDSYSGEKSGHMDYLQSIL